MLNAVLFALWFLLPAALANMAPIFSAVAPLLRNWQAPMDFGKKFRGKRIFGSHKTWRGLLSGMVVATCTLWLQQLAARHFMWTGHFTGEVDYASLPTLLLGPLFGFGALGGDALESFFKRQRGIRPGQTWVPFDQLDYIIGAIVVSLPFVVLSWVQYVSLLVVWFLMHLLATYIGWRLGLKERPI